MLASPSVPETAPETAPEIAPSPTPGQRPWYRSAMHWVRRVHLYSGLFMFPWVMLYAVTALLFNHPGAFPDRPQRVLTAEDFADTALADIAKPSRDAEQVVAALNARMKKDRRSCRIVHPEKAGYTRDVLTIKARGAGQEHAVSLDLTTSTALVSSAEQPEGTRAPFATRGLKVPGALAERVKTGIPKALTRQGLAADDAGMSIGTDLVFYVECDGSIWRATYSTQTGTVTGAPVEEPNGITTRRFLTQLHMSHGYAGSGTRWFWALVVDAMFASMVFWGLSGMLMWWQLKAVRIAGLCVIVSSLVLAVVLAIGMHASMVGR